MKLYFLDNFDSFTYNLVDQFRRLGFEVVIYRNNINAQFLADNLLAEKDTALILSPGPGTPDQAGCMMELISLVAGQVPILGICLGHQALVEHYGGTVNKAPTVVHGKASPLCHSKHHIFADLPSPLPVGRYHSLIATLVPENLEVVAYIESLPMAVTHKQHKSVGFQFHPESILTTLGNELLAQTIQFLTEEK